MYEERVNGEVKHENLESIKLERVKLPQHIIHYNNNNIIILYNGNLALMKLSDTNFL